MAKRATGRLGKMLKALMTSEEFAEFFREAGRKGGQIGGYRAAAAMTAAERTDRAKKAARARWSPAGRAKAKRAARRVKKP
jgi:hypothetical protein